MKYKDRQGNFLQDDETQEKIMRFLYGTYPGQKILPSLTHKRLSKCVGGFLSTKVSALLIPYFVKRNNINPRDFEMSGHKSFNDFFTRRLAPGAREVDMRPEVLISPCDSKLMVYPIEESQGHRRSRFTIKGIQYNMEGLTQSMKLAEVFAGGKLLVFRLAVDDYHRYCYVDNGDKSQNYRIRGAFHTVNPAACEKVAVYKENERVISILKSENFGIVMMMEVGAMMVGRIINYDGPTYVKKGTEKGMFRFGGSTIILAFQKGMVELDRDIMLNSQQGIETKVSYGEKIGRRVYR
ncbi:MAG: phosphatidylserine decarboxylase [Clostridiales bacterium]|nr:phosphatidylserine decarboxylase [Clostridiales bacterium]